MLGKMIKYDLKWVAKVILVFYALAIVFSVVGRIGTSIENSIIFNFIGQFSQGVAVAMMINALVNTIIRFWVRFIRNNYKDESYLTHTLPVKKETIFLSKVLAAIITILVTMLVIAISLLICYYSKENMQMLKSTLEVVATTYDSTIFGLIFVMLLAFSVEVINVLLIGYLGIILGHKSNTNRMVKSIFCGFGLYAVSQILSLGIIWIVGVFNPGIMNLISTSETVEISTIKTFLYGGIGVYTMYALILYFVGNKQFKKGVNVE